MRAKRRKSLVLATLAALVAAVMGCSGGAPTDPAQLEGTWRLESFGGVKELTPTNPDVTTTLTMKAGEATGSGGVNSYSTSYEASDDGKLRFGEITSTLMAGEPAAMEQEAAFFEGLKDTRHYEFNGGKLQLGALGYDTLAVLVRQ